jgi:hypothetical protein
MESESMSFRVKRSKGPAYVVMRDVRTGQPVRIPVGAIPKVFWPETWYENPYWLYSGALSRADVAEFFSDSKQEIRADFAHRLATYILDYVQNTAAVVWLMNPDKEGYLETMKPCIEKLSELKAKAKNRADIMEMIHVCLDYAMDPF